MTELCKIHFIHLLIMAGAWLGQLPLHGRASQLVHRLADVTLSRISSLRQMLSECPWHSSNFAGASLSVTGPTLPVHHLADVPLWKVITAGAWLGRRPYYGWAPALPHQAADGGYSLSPNSRCMVGTLGVLVGYVGPLWKIKNRNHR